MVNKRGGIVAIEPSTGEILALVTAPSYDPALLVGRQRSKNYTKLYNDSIAKPLYDRGLLGEFPPGSPFQNFNWFSRLTRRRYQRRNHIYLPTRIFLRSWCLYEMPLSWWNYQTKFRNL